MGFLKKMHCTYILPHDFEFLFFFYVQFRFIYLFFFIFACLDSSSVSELNFLLPSNTPTVKAAAYADPLILGQPSGGGGGGVFQDTPNAPTDVKAMIVSTRFITLSWTRPTSTNGGIMGYSVFYKQDGSERWVLLVIAKSQPLLVKKKHIESVHVHFDKILPRAIFLTFWVIF